jgi:hypothetical protein
MNTKTDNRIAHLEKRVSELQECIDLIRIDLDNRSSNDCDHEDAYQDTGGWYCPKCGERR